MSMEARLLRELANAVEHGEKVNSYFGQYVKTACDELSVEWSAASACHGYREAQEEIEASVKELWPELVSAARVRVEARVAAARASTCPAGDKYRASPPAPAVAVPELLGKALAALDNYADPTGYTDCDGEQLDANEKVHEGLLAKSVAAEIRAAIAAAPTPPAAEAHPDDLAVDRFAAIMKSKLAVARNKGRGGWEDREQCPDGYLSQLLREHVEKGDPVDVANLAMMLSLRGERIAPKGGL